MFDFGAQRIANFANSLKAMETRLKYQQTGNEFYKILAEAHEDRIGKHFQITRKIKK